MNRIIGSKIILLKRNLAFTSHLRQAAANQATNKQKMDIKLSKVNKNMNLAGTYYEMFDVDIGNAFISLFA